MVMLPVITVVHGGVGVTVGVGVGVGVEVAPPPEPPPQLMANSTNATPERREIDLKRIS